MLEKLKVPDGAPALPPATPATSRRRSPTATQWSITPTELGAVLKHLGREATEVELADMLSELHKAAGGSVDSLSFAVFYAVAPKLLVEAERNWRHAPGRRRRGVPEPRRRPDGGGDGRDRGRAARRAALRAPRRARRPRTSSMSRPSTEGNTFEAFQEVMAASKEGSARQSLLHASKFKIGFYAQP